MYGWRGAREERGAVGDLDDVAEVHHGDAVADVAHHREVVGDEQVGDAELVLQVLRRLITCACTETSSAETGSSQTMSLG